MNTINIKYKLTIYEYNEDLKINVINNLNETFDYNILFPEMIDNIVNKSGIEYFQIYVENLKDNTWVKKLGTEVSEYIIGDNYHYKWFNYKIKDIQNMFNLFDNVINIVIDGPGIGKYFGEKEGIKFIIKNHEKDRHSFEPHVHCKYSNEEIRIRIDTLEIMKSNKVFKNNKKIKVAKKWIEKHQKELLECYNMINGIEENSVCFEAYL